MRRFRYPYGRVFLKLRRIFFGHGAALLKSQVIGVLSIAAWALAASFVLFTVLRKLNGLRVEKRIEEEGLDVYEHGESAYNLYSKNQFKNRPGSGAVFLFIMNAVSAVDIRLQPDSTC